MMAGLDSAQPEQPTPAASMLDDYAGDGEMNEQADAPMEAVMGLITNPHLGDALQQLEMAAQAYPEQGDAAFRNPETLQAIGLALKSFIGQSKGSPLGEDERVGDAEVVDIAPTGRDTLQVRLRVQPEDHYGQRSRDPYEAMLTNGRVPEAAGGQVLELSKQDVAQLIQSMQKAYQLQQSHPEEVAKISQALGSMEHRPLMDLIE